MNRIKNFFSKSICLPSWLIIGIFLFLIIFPFSPFAVFAAFGSVHLFPLLPIIWIFCGAYWLYSSQIRTKFIPIILIVISILISFVSFKLGVFWLTWLLLFILSIYSIYLILNLWRQIKEKVSLKILFGFFMIALICNLLYPLNPLSSIYGFFGTGKLLTLNNPCGNCQKEKWKCNVSICNERVGDIYFCPKDVCSDFKNIKNCYCCECIKNLKYCRDCFLFWDNPQECNPSIGKCMVGW